MPTKLRIATFNLENLNSRGAQQIFEWMTSDVDALAAALRAHLGKK